MDYVPLLNPCGRTHIHTPPTVTCTHLEGRVSSYLRLWSADVQNLDTVALRSWPDLWSNYGKNVCLSIPGVERPDRDIKQITLYTKWNVMAADQAAFCVADEEFPYRWPPPGPGCLTSPHTQTHNPKSCAWRQARLHICVCMCSI